MISFILFLWAISFSLATLFQVDFPRSLLDATGLTCLSIVVGYILTIFYENRKHRTYINWLQIKNYETKRESL
jgi:hypothetical protein